MSAWDGLVEIFTPGHKHLADERDRLQLEAQIPGSEDDDDRRTWVDLDRGIVNIALPPQRFGSVVAPPPRPLPDEEEN